MTDAVRSTLWHLRQRASDVVVDLAVLLSTPFLSWNKDKIAQCDHDVYRSTHKESLPAGG